MSRPDVSAWHEDADVKMFKGGDEFWHLAATDAPRAVDPRTVKEQHFEFVIAPRTRCGLTTADRRLWDDFPAQDLIPLEKCPDC